MIYVAEFEKVTKERFEYDMVKSGYTDFSYDNIIIPTRATSGSAGYDIHTPVAINVKAGETVLVPLGIRCKIDEDWFLAIVPKSGLGFNYGMRLSNTFGVVDSDYSHSENEGHIMAKFSVDKDLELKAGDKLCQGIFIKYGITVDDKADGIRNGGFGSTGR